MNIEFVPWGKIPRLNRNIIITEKIDGTNSAVGIKRFSYEEIAQFEVDSGYNINEGMSKILGMVINPEDGGGEYAVYAQSRTRLITPEQDNHGFARWVRDNAEALALTLGEGLHFGEYWGSGIQRGYGLQKGEKRFSLFNTPRYGDPSKVDIRPLKSIGVDIVPILYQGLFDQITIRLELERLAKYGSQAALGFMDPEGIVVYHVAAGVPFKVTIKGDEKPKGSNEIG